MVPATLSQLEEIAKLSERKDDLEDNYNKLSGSMDSLLDAMTAMTGSLNASANGPVLVMLRRVDLESEIVLLRASICPSTGSPAGGDRQAL